MSINVVSYEDVTEFTNKDEETIIDVREPRELQDTGVIPNSINIPLATLEDIFQNSSDEDFKAKFGRPKPSKNDPITVSCKMGGRSAKAQVLLRSLGFIKVDGLGETSLKARPINWGVTIAAYYDWYLSLAPYHLKLKCDVSN